MNRRRPILAALLLASVSLFAQTPRLGPAGASSTSTHGTNSGVFPSPGSAATAAATPVPALVSSDKAHGADGCSIPAMTTTGATLLVAEVCVDSQATDVSNWSDSLTNSWTALTNTANGTMNCNTYYAGNATVGAAQTFSYVASGSLASCVVASFSLVKAASPLDKNSVASDLAPGAITPTENGELIVGMLGLFTTPNPTGCTGCTIIQIQPASGGVLGASMGYFIQTTAASTNPTWDQGSGPVARALSFKHQ